MRSLRVAIAVVGLLAAFCLSGCLDDGIGKGNETRTAAVNAAGRLCDKPSNSTRAGYINSLLDYQAAWNDMSTYGQIHSVKVGDLVSSTAATCKEARNVVDKLRISSPSTNAPE